MFKRDAGAGFASLALHLKPAVTAVKALRYRWGRLGRSAEAFHLFRPQQALGSVRLANGLLCPLSRMPGMDFRAANPITEYALSRWSAHGGITAALAAAGNPTRI
jgi:hypothetical protein